MRQALRATAAGVLLLLALPWTVLADALIADGDGVVPVTPQRLNFGTVCAGVPVSADALVAVRATNHPGGRMVFANGALVDVTITSVTGPGLSATGPSTPITLPADWVTLPNLTMSDPAVVTVSYLGATPGAFNGALGLRATGPGNRVAQATHNATLRVRARVVDCDPPVVTPPPDQQVEATGPGGATVDYPPATAEDAVDGPTPVVCAPAPGSTFPLGVTTVTCESTDAAGNRGTASFLVSVVDTSAPELTGMPADMTVAASGPEGTTVDYPPPSASDLVDGAVPVSCAPASGEVFPVGVTQVTCQGTDAAGNRVEASFVVTVVDDDAPVFSDVPPDMAVASSGPEGTTVDYVPPSATDALDGPVAVSCVQAPGQLFGVGDSLVTCSATDSAGNRAEVSFWVSVSYAAPPDPQPKPIPAPSAPPPPARPAGQALGSSDLPDTATMTDTALAGWLGAGAVLALFGALVARRSVRRWARVALGSDPGDR